MKKCILGITLYSGLQLCVSAQALTTSEIMAKDQLEADISQQIKEADTIKKAGTDGDDEASMVISE